MSAQAALIPQPSELIFPPLSGRSMAGERLEKCARLLREHVQSARQQPATPAARWLIDHYSFLQFQIRETRRNLPRSYVRQLLKAGSSPLADEPRVYRIAADLVAQTLAVIDSEVVGSFAQTLKERSCLTLSELWAFGSIVRLVILERLCAQLEAEPIVSACIKSLRALENISWRDFVESVSAADEILRRDPAQIYGRMDFATRDRYRHEIERLAQRSGRSEVEVAEAALKCAAETANQAQAHVGHELIGSRAEDFARRIGLKRSLHLSLAWYLERWPGLFYGFGLALLTTLISVGFVRLTGHFPWWIAILLAIPVSQAALEIVNTLVSHLLPPRSLPAMDFTDGIATDCKTMVVVPTLLLSQATVARLLEDLEIRYLANRDPNLFFALLTDFADADQPLSANDSVLEPCLSGIDRLNTRYGSCGSGPFYLFHRARQWNPSESKWMGSERKRGKLNDLNHLLLGRGNNFDSIAGDVSRLSEIRYVITLDSDTQLPRDTAAKLVGAMAHPLNRPVVDPKTNLVIDGYALIRPRVSVSMESAGRSRLSQLFSGQAGFDPYATAVSDVYQDLHGQASFTGKGIYDVRAFDAAVGNRFPDNAILSHDLIEGEHARTGLLTSAELVEDYPPTYRAFSKRKHRWVRGDWQLLPWLFSRPPVPGGRACANPLGVLSRWKIFDNLRRSLFEISLLALLVAGWFSVDQSMRWTLAVLALLQLPTYVDFMLSIIRTPERRFWLAFAHNLGGRFLQRHRDTLLNLVLVPHQACLMADAIARTLIRRFITRRKLLQWETMAQSELASGMRMEMVEGYFHLSAAASLLFLLTFPALNPVIALLGALWVVAPLIADWLNEPLPAPAALSDSDQTFLRDAALRTWRFFADHSTPETHWLVPDNVQEDPPLLAHRMSPTNLGLQLTANLAAHDFGYQNTQELSLSLQRLFESMDNMPRYRGHFYNWCDTRLLCPIAPLYVSTVDSGNLGASLCTLRQGCLSLLKQPAVSPSLVAGLRDHVRRLRDELPSAARSLSIMRLMGSLLRQLECQPADWFFWEGILSEARDLVARIEEALVATHKRETAKSEEIRYWEHQLLERINADLAELYSLAPWLAPDVEPELRVNLRDASLAPLVEALSSVPVLAGLPDAYQRIRQRLIERLESSEPLYPALRTALQEVLCRLPAAQAAVLGLIRRLEKVAEDSARYLDEMDFHFLYDSKRKLLRIGYDVDAALPDESCYDLLASEARTAVFIAIAKGDIRREAWFRLGRKLTAYRNERSLVSWSGTMFEYLMPLLHLRSYPNTLLDRGLRGAIRIQQVYARERSVPWGISEAAYSTRDSQMQYQYRAFGIPALSARPDSAENLVVAPYASMLALMVDPKEATANLRALAGMDCLRRYGFLEALDYGSSLAKWEPIRCYMAHHQGMGLLAIDNALMGGQMQERFHLDPSVQATEFLLQERMPVLVEEHAAAA